MSEHDEIRRLKKAMRVGVLCRPEGIFKPMVTVGIASDGGVFAVPAPVGNTPWCYGTLRQSGPHDDVVTTSLRPKVHYHRSGIAAVTLTGADLEPRKLQMPPITAKSSGQILSVVTFHPKQLADSEMRVGDLCLTCDRWPKSAAFSFSLIGAQQNEVRALLIPGLEPVGLLPLGDSTPSVVSLVGYGYELLIVCNAYARYENPHQEHGTTVTAVPWKPYGPDSWQEMLGLWSVSLRNPCTVWEPDMLESLEPKDDLVKRCYPNLKVADKSKPKVRNK